MSEFNEEFDENPDPKQDQEGKRGGEERRNGKDRPKVLPTHRVSFAAIIGKDQNGRDVLGPKRQIGSIWPRQGLEGEGIQRFDHMPEELRGRGGGVLFVSKLDPQREKHGDKAAQREKPARKDEGYER